MLKKTVHLVILAGVIAGCGGGGGGISTAKAYYIDSPVEGVTYKCGLQEGTTDVKGMFIFEKSKGCTFYLGEILLKSIDASILADGIEIKETNVNTARLLQSLDWDGNPNNGITIKPDIVKQLKTKGFTAFPTQESDFENLDTLLRQLRSEESGFKGTVVSAEEAKAHLEGNHPPIISATATPAIIYEGESVHFDASQSHDPDRGDQLHYLWKVGNTTLSQQRTFTHIFNSPGNYTVTLTLTDTQGGRATKNFTIRVDEGSRDHTPPTITLKGDDPLKTVLNETITDPGVEVSDDQDTPSQITVTTTGHINPDGTIMTNVIGKFTIDYNATDSSGNSALKTRELFVQFPQDYNKHLSVLGDTQTGVIKDNSKNLVWANSQQGCLKVSAGTDEAAKSYATGFCSNLNTIHYGGYDGWRVGTPEENRDFMIQAFGEGITPFYTHPSCVRMMGIDAEGKITIIKTHNTHDIGGYEAHTFTDTKNQVAGVRCVTDQTTPNQPPIANAGADISVEVNATFTFDGRGSSDPDGTIVKYEWIYNGSVINPDTSSAIYTSEATQPAGDYNVTLRVTDNKDATDEDWVIVHVIPKQ